MYVEILIIKRSVVMVVKFIEIIGHIPGLLDIMNKVVTIWGLLNFVNQLSLQNASSVADRALGRLPGLKKGIEDLQGCLIADQNLSDEEKKRNIAKNVASLTGTYQKLFVDLKQLGIAKQFYNIKNRIGILLKDELICHDQKDQYLTDQFGDGWQDKFQQNKEELVSLIGQLEAELMNIFDMSQTGENFITHFSNNLLRIVWFSLTIYMIQCQNMPWAGGIFIGGIMFFIARYFHDKE